MNLILRQVRKARGRLIVQQFLGVLSWSLFGALMIAVVGLAVPKIWFLEISWETWRWAWLGGSLAAGLLLSLLCTYVVRRSVIDAAIELDRRCSLKERVSSALALSTNEQETEAGQALLKDASRRVERIEVGEHFPVALRPWNLLPLVPALAVFVLLMFVDNATRDPAKASSEAKKTVDSKVKKILDSQQRKIEERKKKLTDPSNEPLKEMLEKMEQVLGDAQKNGATKKDTMVALNDLAQQIEKEKQRIGDNKALEKQMEKLGNIAKGPAEKLAEALKDAKFDKAAEAIKDMKAKLEAGKLTAQEKEQLAQQLKQMQDKMNKIKDAHEQAKSDLKKQIEEKKQQGDMASASKLQKQLDKMNALDKQMGQMQQMAEQMKQASEKLEQGDAQAAAEQLGKMQEQLQEMKQQMKQMQMMDEMAQEIADAKGAMDGEMNESDESSDGGEGKGNDGMAGENEQGGDGMGEGQGQGSRPEEKTDTGKYNARERGNAKKGEVIRSGEADGPNRAGQSLESLKQELRADTTKSADPTNNQRLPRFEREHSNEYFQRIRDGK